MITRSANRKSTGQNDKQIMFDASTPTTKAEREREREIEREREKAKTSGSGYLILGVELDHGLCLESCAEEAGQHLGRHEVRLDVQHLQRGRRLKQL